MTLIDVISDLKSRIGDDAKNVRIFKILFGKCRLEVYAHYSFSGTDDSAPMHSINIVKAHDLAIINFQPNKATNLKAQQKLIQ